MAREIHTGWDGAARQGVDAVGKMPKLTERSDLGSINADTKAGWGQAMSGGSKKRVAAKLGRSLG